jgi:Mn2+/Fe2+ NRAMP family transporter
MGNFVNSTAFNIIAWITVAVVVMLSIVLLVTTLFPKLAG